MNSPDGNRTSQVGSRTVLTEKKAHWFEPEQSWGNKISLVDTRTELTKRKSWHQNSSDDGDKISLVGAWRAWWKQNVIGRSLNCSDRNNISLVDGNRTSLTGTAKSWRTNPHFSAPELSWRTRNIKKSNFLGPGQSSQIRSIIYNCLASDKTVRAYCELWLSLKQL